MVSDLIKIDPNKIDVILDLRYATSNNVCKQKLYQQYTALIHPEGFQKLEIAVQYARNLGYKLKIFDAYRPLKVQKFMYDFFAHDENLKSFFSNPETGSTPHCRGVAIDLTLCDLQNKELDMGSDFDELSDLAFHNCNKISQQQLNNRNILLGIMTFAGFDFYSREWWHYQLFNARQYPIGNVNLD